MGRVNTPVLRQEQRQSLEQGLKQGKSHCFRMRCQSILLKGEGRTSQEVGRITGMSNISVNSWLKRFKAEGIAGLHTKPGRGRKPIIDETEDKTAVLEAIRANRQRLQTAKAEWEAASGKSVSRETFRHFLKRLAEDING
jgi:transposase